ncbi:MAG: FAD-binding oxidoreductase [Flavobacteriaceae bacterium]|nr:MAG: FAD-binding oxidoreductase [Flavobacteriaceae bacterium]
MDRKADPRKPRKIQRTLQPTEPFFMKENSTQNHSTGETYQDIYRWGNKKSTEVDLGTLAFLEKRFSTQRETQRKIGKMVSSQKTVEISPSKLLPEHKAFFENLLGKENVKSSDFARANHSFGKFYTDLLFLRNAQVPFPPDVVLSPKNHQEIESIVAYCNQHKIAILPFAGGSSVTRALEFPHGGVALDLKSRLNQIIEINQTNHTVTAQSGILGPDLEAALNKEGYTCGHFPQSFEFSTLGGWVAAKGAGQCSTGYGRAEELLVSLKAVTPIGTFEGKDFPSAVQGFDLKHLFVGSEGTLGVITEVTWKIFKHRPQNTQKSSFIFKDFFSSTAAMREMIQNEIGKPHLFRISDGKETDFAFSHLGFQGTWKDKLLSTLGYKSPQRCTMVMTVEGESTYGKSVMGNMKKIARKHGGFPSGEEPINKWLKQRFDSPYLRDGLMEEGYMIDTLETAVTWDNLHGLWQAIHRYFETNPKVYGMSHISHVYPNGCNIYAIFISPMKDEPLENTLKEFHAFQQGIIQTFVENKGSISHHHGVGRMGAEFMSGQFPKEGFSMMQGIKDLFDPSGIMNPGGNMLGLKDRFGSEDSKS